MVNRIAMASLWSVDDTATEMLLTAYMQAREKHENQSDALRDALLATRQTFAEPYFWASFVLTGVPYGWLH